MVVVTLQHLVALSSVRIYIHKDLRPQENCTLGVKVPHSRRFVMLIFNAFHCSTCSAECCVDTLDQHMVK